MRSYCRIIGGFDDFGFTAFSSACDTMLRLRSSGARARDWFCIRGRSVEERTMVTLGPARTTGRPYQGYHGVAQSPQGVAVIVAKTTNILKATTIFSKQRQSQNDDLLQTATARTEPGRDGRDRGGQTGLRYSSSSGCSSG